MVNITILLEYSLEVSWSKSAYRRLQKFTRKVSIKVVVKTPSMFIKVLDGLRNRYLVNHGPWQMGNNVLRKGKSYLKSKVCWYLGDGLAGFNFQEECYKKNFSVSTQEPPRIETLGFHLQILLWELEAMDPRRFVLDPNESSSTASL